jgi:hypothetical protein
VKGSPGQYSGSLVDWMLGRLRSDPAFFAKARDRRKALRGAARTAAATAEP